ncbi:sulfurtransferase TusA family protein [Candidatus Pyrohabitans sp.]
MKPKLSVDCVGMHCPVPLSKAGEALQKLALGEVLEIVADDEDILDDLPAWCRVTGNEYLGHQREGRIIRAYIKRKV